LDYCILVDEDEIEMAQIIVQNTYDEWWDDEGVSQTPIAEIIKLNLRRTGIECEIYSKSNGEEE
jgi:hypothetical protein